ELRRLAGARIVDLDVGSFTAAARGVHQLGGAGAALFREIADAERFASRLEERVFGICVLGKVVRDRPAGLERAVRVEVPQRLAGGKTRDQQNATGHKDLL